MQQMQANYIDNNTKKKVGWSNTPIEHPTSFGVASGGRDDGIKSKLVNLISSVRTLMRSMFILYFIYIFFCLFVFVPGARGSGWSLADTCGFVLVPLIVINTLVIVYELVLG